MDDVYCTFIVASTTCAIRANVVVEVVLLPALSPLRETPKFIIGAFNLRGRIVPVMDLAARLDAGRHRPRTSDHVIIIEHDGLPLGLLVEEALDVKPLATAHAEGPPANAHAQRAARFIEGIAKDSERLITLIDPDKLVLLPAELPPALPSAPQAAGDAAATGRTGASGDASPASSGFSDAELHVLQERARRLAAIPEAEETGLRDVVIVEAGGELVGCDPHLVSGFAPLHDLTPVPGVPPHVLGLANLRAQVVTVVDLRPVLSLRVPDVPLRMMALIGTPEGPLGLAVEDIIGVAPLRLTPLSTSPSAARYFTAGATASGRHVSFLDLRELLASGALAAPEEARTD